MNVYRQDDSLKKLNYYSRFSPKKNNHKYHLNSPLINHSTHKKQNARLVHTLRQHSSANQSVSRRLQFTLKPINNNRQNSFFQNAYSNEPPNNFILIDDSETEEENNEPDVDQVQEQNGELFLPKNEIPTMTEHQLQQKSFSNSLSEESPSKIQKTIRQVGNILIEQDDVSEQNEETNNETFPKMNRHYTFGSPLNQPHQQNNSQQKHQIQKTSPQLVQFQSNMNVPSLSNQKQMQPQSNQNNFSNKKANNSQLKQLILIDDGETNELQTNQYDVQIPFCSSPKFNITPFISQQSDQLDKEQLNISSESNKTQNSPINQIFHSVYQTKPFTASLQMIQQLLECLPQNLYTTYYGMYRKLSVDQRDIHQKLIIQQKKIQVLKSLKQLKKIGMQCQLYLLQDSSDAQTQQILLNQIMIRAIIKKLNK